MAYKFQFGAATMSGSLTQEEGITTTTLSATGDVDLGNATTDTITATGQFDSDLVPSSDSARDLGTSAKQWAEAHIDAGYIDDVTTTGTTTTAALTATANLDIGAYSLTALTFTSDQATGTAPFTVSSTTQVANLNAATLGGADFASPGAIGGTAASAGTFAAVIGTTGVYSGILKTDDTTEATSTTDGSLQTDGGLSVVKSAVIGDDLDLLSDGAILSIGSTSKFVLTDQSANNAVMAASGARLAFGDAGEYISGDGTDLKIVSSNDIDVTGDLDVVGGVTSTLISALASSSGTTSIGSTTAAVFTAAGLLNVNNATEATSATDGSLQTDGGLSVVKSAVIGDDLDLLSDAAILNFGADKDTNLTHVADTGLLLNSSRQLQFGDSGTYMAQSADGALDAVSDGSFNVTVGAAGMVLKGTTPKLTIGDAGAEDTAIVFDGNAADWSMGIDDSDDVFEIRHGTTPATDVVLSADTNGQLLKLNAAAAAVTVSADHIMFYDGGATAIPKVESIADLATAMAGAGITATNGVFSTDASSTPNELTIGATCAEGFNYINSTLTGAFAAYLPATPTAGDIVYVKARDGVSSSNSVTIIKTTASHTIDGQTQLVIESPYGAIALSYVNTNDWRVF